MLEVSDERQTIEPCEILADSLNGVECPIKLPREWLEDARLRGPLPRSAIDLRRFVRFYYHVVGILHYRTTLPTMPRSGKRYLIYTKNVSRTGLAFLHFEQLYPRERMTLQLQGAVKRDLEIVRCQRINDSCFEIGARFV